MTIDERIERLTTNQEKTEVLMAKVLDTVMRLERIALSHEDRLQDVEAVLAKLEGRARKPQ